MRSWGRNSHQARLVDVDEVQVFRRSTATERPLWNEVSQKNVKATQFDFQHEGAMNHTYVGLTLTDLSKHLLKYRGSRKRARVGWNVA